jgi:hypothetical protein
MSSPTCKTCWAPLRCPGSVHCRSCAAAYFEHEGTTTARLKRHQDQRDRRKAEAEAKISNPFKP